MVLFSDQSAIWPAGRFYIKLIYLNQCRFLFLLWKVSPGKTEYCVQLHQAEWDDAQELPQRVFPLNKDEDYRQATPYEEPRVIFLLRRPTVMRPPLIFRQ
jgi:hypothetical protein